MNEATLESVIGWAPGRPWPLTADGTPMDRCWACEMPSVNAFGAADRPGASISACSKHNVFNSDPQIIRDLIDSRHPSVRFADEESP